MERRLSFVTLGVADLERATRFYQTGLGLPRLDSPPTASFFDLGETWLALYPRHLLAADAGVSPAGSGFTGFALAHNVRSEAEADRLLQNAAAAGGRIVKPGQPTDWGGYAGYFADPDGFLWEVAWNPGFRTWTPARSEEGRSRTGGTNVEWSGPYEERTIVDTQPALRTAEDASPRELWRASWKLLLTLAALGLLVIPLIRELPLGQSTRTGLLAWLLVGLAFYWIYAGMGYRPLLLLQLLLFSTAAALLSAKLLLVAIDVRSMAVLRYAARGLILVGAGCAIANLGAMLLMLWRRRKAPVSNGLHH